MKNQNDQNDNLSKRDKFKKYGNIRLNNAIESIRRLGNLSNKRAYDYSKKDVNLIHDTLRAEIGALKAKFEEAEKKSKKKNEDILVWIKYVQTKDVLF